jgi:hypothetical protein
MKAISEIAQDALQLPPEQRRTLARILLDLSDENQEFSPEVDAVWDDEIGRRMAAVKTGTATHSSFAEVFARLDARFAR